MDNVMGRALPRAMAAQVAPQVPPVDFEAISRELERRRRAVEGEMERAAAPPDRSKLEAYGRERGQQSTRALVLALAAQQAGKGFEPLQQHFMGQSEWLARPVDTQGGQITPEGFVADPDYERSHTLKRLDAKLAQIDRLEGANMTAQERSRLAAERQQAQRERNAEMDALRREGFANARTVAGIAAGQRPLSDKARSDLDEADAIEQGLKGAVDALKTAPGKGTGWAAGVAQNIIPGGQSVVAGRRDPATNDAIQRLTYVTDGIRHGRFGAALTTQEKASASQYLPSEYDSLEQMRAKADGLQGLIALNNRRLRERGAQQPGGAPAAPSGAVVDFSSLPKGR